MIVSELIEKLKEFDGELVVKCFDNDAEDFYEIDTITKNHDMEDNKDFIGMTTCL